MKKYRHIAVGGTFDRLHKGHESLLKKALTTGQRVTIGITSSSMVDGKTLSSAIAPFQERKKNVQRFIESLGKPNTTTTTKLKDSFGSLRTDKSIEAVVVGPRVSSEMIKSLEKLLPVVRCKTVYAQDGKHISSTRIRSGEIDRVGNLYAVYKKTLRLPKSLRSTLREPLGDIVESTSLNKYLPKKGEVVISVGDESTARLVLSGTIPHLAVVDFHVKRKQIHNNISSLGFSKALVAAEKINVIEGVKNKAGTISKLLFKSVEISIESAIAQSTRSVVVVDGEEDLATLACVLRAPLLAHVYYGQPNKGIVRVVVTEKNKQLTRSVLSRFS